jgi:4-oxalocrotonate tautomerase family enzyme
MPYINVKLYPGRSDEQKREVSRRIVQAVMEVCNVNDPAACAVVIEELTPEQYQATAVPEIQARASQQYFP